MELVMIKMISGEVVMGRRDVVTNENYTIGKPVTLMFDPMQQGVAMVPMDSLYTGQELPSVTIKAEHVLYELPIQKEFEEGYIKHTSGIELAS
jgi:hypothetical protein